MGGNNSKAEAVSAQKTYKVESGVVTLCMKLVKNGQGKKFLKISKNPIFIKRAISRNV
jgi:hypothetical protein